jgi:hypothetical protein
VLLAFQIGRYPLAFCFSSNCTKEEISESTGQLIRHMDQSGQAKAVEYEACDDSSILSLILNAGSSPQLRFLLTALHTGNWTS